VMSERIMMDFTNTSGLAGGHLMLNYDDHLPLRVGDPLEPHDKPKHPPHAKSHHSGLFFCVYIMQASGFDRGSL